MCVYVGAFYMRRPGDSGSVPTEEQNTGVVRSDRVKGHEHGSAAAWVERLFRRTSREREREREGEREGEKERKKEDYVMSYM